MDRPTSGSARVRHLDAVRGVLLVAMVAVHVVSRHATAEQATWMHRWVGIFLISAGFVTLSGFVHGLRPGGTGARDWLRSGESCLHLLLVMAGYALLFSLVRHVTTGMAGGPGACESRYGWIPPTRFDDLGILLPIALVRLLAPLSRAPARVALFVVVPLAILGVLVPGLEGIASGRGPFGWVSGVLFNRTLTPFYTVSHFVAFGLLGTLAGRHLAGFVTRTDGRSILHVAWLALALILSIPAVSSTVLDAVYSRSSGIGGAVGTLLYWSSAILALVHAFTGPTSTPLRSLRAVFECLGRHSLFVFVAHDFLILFNDLYRAVSGTPKSLVVVATMFAFDVVVLALACRLIEARSAVQKVLASLLLETKRPRFQALSTAGIVAITAVLSTYVSYASKGPEVEVVIDDFEEPNGCPPWWSFGGLVFTRTADITGSDDGNDHYLAVRGSAAGMFAHGHGLSLQRPIGERRTLKLDVRGYGPRSGHVKIELCEDDNGNWEIEKDGSLHTPLYDDRFVYQFHVDWTGWRGLSLPLEQFHDDNINGGNNQFDPERDLTSGGLLELQLLFSPASTEDDLVRLDLDTLRWAP